MATYKRCGGTHNNRFSENLLLENLPVKVFRKSIKIWHDYGDKFGVQFFWPTLYVVHCVWQTDQRRECRWRGVRAVAVKSVIIVDWMKHVIVSCLTLLAVATSGQCWYRDCVRCMSSCCIHTARAWHYDRAQCERVSLTGISGIGPCSNWGASQSLAFQSNYSQSLHDRAR